MVIDTSALISILLQEDDAESIGRAIKGAKARALSAVSRVELSFVVESRNGEIGRHAIEDLLAEAEVEVVSVTPAQAQIAIQAFRDFGKGRHPARLNFGDCFAYALAKTLNEPLLFKGEDFAKTDVEAAVIPDR